MNICQCCGQRVRKLNPHRMCANKVKVLEYLAQARADGHPWVRFWQGHHLEINGMPIRGPYESVQLVARLVWFGLAERLPGVRRSGEYAITDNGVDFLRGKHSVPELIYVRESIVVERSATMVFIDDIKDVVFDKAYWDNYPAIQKDAPIEEPA